MLSQAGGLRPGCRALKAASLTRRRRGPRGTAPTWRPWKITIMIRLRNRRILCVSELRLLQRKAENPGRGPNNRKRPATTAHSLAWYQLCDVRPQDRYTRGRASSIGGRNEPWHGCECVWQLLSFTGLTLERRRRIAGTRERARHLRAFRRPWPSGWRRFSLGARRWSVAGLRAWVCSRSFAFAAAVLAATITFGHVILQLLRKTRLKQTGRLRRGSPNGRAARRMRYMR
jgi:hypothetical protein